jgi:hypothetical protein
MQPQKKEKMKSITMRRPKGFGMFVIAVAAVSIGAFGAGCDPAPKTPVTTPAAIPSPAASASPAASPAVSPSGSPALAGKAESLVGRWTGPEGTYLAVTKKGEGYSIEIKNLDAAKTFEGTAKGDVIEFTRNGKTETIKSATGIETGMKGFEKETNCVVVTKGSEGYCKK